MKYRLAALFGLAILSGAEVSALEPDKLFKLIAPRVWLVRTFNADGLPLSSNSAVVIQPRKLITNCHVLGKASSFSLVKDKASIKAALEQVDLEM